MASRLNLLVAIFGVLMAEVVATTIQGSIDMGSSSVIANYLQQIESTYNTAKWHQYLLECGQ